MKLPEADFRPKRRSGHVPSTRRRKIPLLRILLLLAAGIFVYRQFDTFWPKVRSWIRPSSAASQSKAYGMHVSRRNAASAAGTWVFSTDSSQAFLNFGALKEKDGCAEMERLRTGLCGQERAVLKKANWLRSLNKPVLSKVEVSLPPAGSPPETPASLVVLEGRDSAGDFRYRRVGGGDAPSSWCDATRGCLTSPPPRLPMAKGKVLDSASGELVAHWRSSLPKVFPVLPGTVVSADSAGPRNYQVTLYHGNELYTTYASLGGLANGLKPGAQINPLQPIGDAAFVDSTALPEPSQKPMKAKSKGLAKNNLKNKNNSKSVRAFIFEYGLDFSVEQAGMPLDPMEFLAGSQSTSGTGGTSIAEGNSHGP